MKRKSFMFYVLAVLSLAFIASPVSANHFNTVDLTADCEKYSINVTGGNYEVCTVDYVLDFTPALPSDSVTGSFEVPNGSFDVTHPGVFGDIPCGEYKINGTVNLTCRDKLHDTASLPEEEIICPCDEGLEGCTPGFWKNNAGLDYNYKNGRDLNEPQDNCWSCGDYYAAKPLSEVFDNTPNPTDTMIDALNYGGSDGQVGNLLRHAVAALLNACSMEFKYTDGEIKTMVNDVLPDNATGIERVQGLLASANESEVDDVCTDGRCEDSMEECNDDGLVCDPVHNCPIDSHCNIKIPTTSPITYDFFITSSSLQEAMANCGGCGQPDCDYN